MERRVRSMLTDMRSFRGAAVRYVALGLAVGIGLTAQQPVETDNPYPFRAASPSASFRIAQLRNDIQAAGAPAILGRNGTPIIERIPGDDRHSLVTFVWRGSAEAHNVVITDGVSVGVGGVDPMNSELADIPDTDVGIALTT